MQIEESKESENIEANVRRIINNFNELIFVKI